MVKLWRLKAESHKGSVIDSNNVVLFELLRDEKKTNILSTNNLIIVTSYLSYDKI